MAHLARINSTDVLFPEEGPHNPYIEDTYYSPPSNSSYSSYTQEVKYVFEPIYSAPKHTNHSDYTDITSYNQSREGDEDESNETDHYGTPPPLPSIGQRLKSYPITNYNHGVKYRQKSNFYNSRQPYQGYQNKYNPQTVAEKRRTWSPQSFEKVMGNGSSFNTPIRSYRSNDQLDVDNGNYYEDLDCISAGGPPRLAPVSGMLNKNAHKSVIKPIAFKPVVPNRYVSNPEASPPFQHSPQRTTPPKQSFDMRMSNHSQDDGYASQEYNSGTHSHSTSNISQGSLHIDTTETPQSYHSDSHRLCERPDSYNSSLLSHHSGNHIDGFMQTPSPSDSGVVEEAGAMLREKDAEILNLRETMEHNETVIFKVYKEKEQNWEMEYRELHAQWEQKLKQQQQKSFKMEQALLLQLFKLQQERKNLRLDIEQMRNSKDQMQHKYESTEEDLRQTKLKLEEIQWDLCQKTGEISLLKSQLKDSKDETSTKANDMLGLKSQLRDLQTETLERHAEVQRLQSELQRARDEYLTAKKELEQAKDKVKLGCEKASQTESHSQVDTSVSSQEISAEKSLGLTSSKPTETSCTVEDLKAEMEKIKRQSVADKEQWLEEKNKVIRYQKHLQLNYVQMVNKNKLLEAEVEQLTLELENRDLQLGTQANGMIDDLPEGQESTC